MTGTGLADMLPQFSIVNGQWDVMNEKIKTVQLSLSGVVGKMTELSDTVKGIKLDGFDAAFGNTGDTAVKILSLGASIMGITASVNEVHTVLNKTGLFGSGGKIAKGVSGAMEAVGLAVSGITSSLGIGLGPLIAIGAGIAAAVAGAVLAVVDLWNTSEGFRDVVGGAFGLVKDSFLGVLEHITPLWGKIKELGAALYEFYESSGLKEIVQLFVEVGAVLLSIISSAVIETIGLMFTGLADIVSGIIDIFTGVVGIFNSFFTQDPSALLDGFKSIGEGILSLFTGVGEFILGWLSSIWGGFPMLLAGPIQSAFNEVKNILSAMAGNFKQIFEGIMQTAKGVINFFTGIFTGDWRRAWEGIKSIFQGIVNTFAGVIKVPANGVIGLVNGLLRGVASGFNKMVDIVNSFSFKVPAWLGGGSVGFNLKHWSAPSIPYLAGGGILNTGQMFIAREAGPELVGQIGRQTAVANNEQITTAIERAVVNGMMQVMLSAKGQSDEGGTIEIPLIVGNEEIARAAYKGQLSLDKRYRVVSQFV